MTLAAVGAVSPPAAPASASPRADATRAAAMLEGLFLHQLLKVMRQSVPESALFGESMGQSIFTEMFDQAVAEEASRGEGFGLRQILLEQLGGAAGRGSSPAGSPALARLAGVSPQRAAEALRQVAALAEPGRALGGVEFEAPNRPEPVAVRDLDNKLRWPVDDAAATTAAGGGGWTVHARPGAPVLAAGSGQVVFADERSLTIDHGRGLHTRYGGLGRVLAQRGDIVLRGQSLGSVGGAGAFAFSAARSGRALEVAEMTGLFAAPDERGEPQVR
jgi:flagellar protein FlgJ